MHIQQRMWLPVVLLALPISAVTRYVALNGSHVAPFDTWAKAATNIQAAVDACSAGDEVIVSNGVYASGARMTPGAVTSNRVVITNAIHVRSLSGPAATVIVGSGPLIYNALRCAYVGGGGMLSGFTLTNGHTLALQTGAPERTSDADGGGVLLGPGSSLSNCVIVGNSCLKNGGGVCALTNSVVTHCVIVGNAAEDGGAVYMSTGAVVRNCVIEENQATSDGGGVFCDGGGLVRNCVVARNYAEYAGVYCWFGGALENCTITRNRTGGIAFASDGVYCFRGGALRNTIVYYNEPGRDFKFYTSYDGMQYCCVPESSAAESNTVAAPQFMDMSNGNYRLQASSPCINTGLNAAWMAAARDLDGQARIVNGIVDMGAYEAGVWQCDIVANVRTGMAPLSVTLTARVSGSNATDTVYFWDYTNDGVIDAQGTGVVSVVNVYSAGVFSVCLAVSNAASGVAQVVKTNMIVALTPLAAEFVASSEHGPVAMAVQFIDLSTPAPQFWRWDFNGDGVIDSVDQHPSYLYMSSGVYSVTLRVSNYFGSVGGGSFAMITKTNFITVTNAVHATHYVAPWGGHVSPFIAWSEAATNLQDAVDAASAGEEVLVADGVYASGRRRLPRGDSWARVAVTKPVTVRSVNGPGAALIVGDGYVNELPVRGAFLSNGAVLCGFTISNGITSSSGDPLFDGYGGGVYMGWNSVVSNCVITGCAAVGTGGGVYGWATSVVANCVVRGNRAGGAGGGVSCGAGIVHDSVIEENDAGGVHATVTVLERCVVRRNRGSGISITSTGAARNCVIMNNSNDFGGGVYIGNGALLENCFIAGNEASKSGGGVYVHISGALRGCTLTGNRAVNYGGGIRSPSAGWIENCIIYHNEAGLFPNCHIGTLPVRYSCTMPLPAGVGNFTNDPGLLARDNPHLSAGSPCVNAGTNTAGVATDIDGEPRVVDGRVDIGCDEYIAAGITGALQVSIVAEYTNIGVGYAARFLAAIEGKASTTAWAFGDGTSAANAAEVRHAWTAPGTYHVRLTAWNNERSAAATVAVVVSAAVTNYVALGGGHVPPFITWSTAATSLHAAVSAAWPGNVVMVTDGTYVLAGSLEITKSLKLRSVNGAAATVLRGTGNGRCVRVACLEPVVINGFTITNGSTRGEESMGGGMYVYGGHQVLNCVFAGNSATGTLGFGGGLYCFMGGTVSNCLFIGNRGMRGGGLYSEGGQTIMASAARGNNAAHFGGGLYVADGAVARACAVEGNEAGVDGGGVWVSGAQLAESVIVSNRAVERGGGVGASASTVTGCVVRGNVARDGGGAEADNAGMFTGCRIEENSATTRGGGVYFSDAGSLVECAVVSNTAAVGRGGGAYFFGAGTITGGALLYNSASNGGAVYMAGGGLVRVAVLVSNRADTGGGVQCDGGGVVSNCLVQGNAARAGGGVYSTSYGTLYTSRIHDNWADVRGGGVHAVDGSITLRSCEVVGNAAGEAGGGVYWQDATMAMKVENCTVTSNRASSAGGVWAAGGGTMINTIVYHNDGGDVLNTGAGAALRYCCVSAAVAGEGNITNEPMFKNFVARDLRLEDASPCMDAGSNLAWTASAPDIAGRPRKLGPYVDMGAHEATRGAVIQLTPRYSLILTAVTGSVACGSVRVDNLGRAVLTGEVLGISWPFALESGSPYVIGSETNTSVMIRFEPVEEGLTNILVTFTGGGDATLRIWGQSYIPEAEVAAVSTALFTMRRLRRKET